jgi:hypothetical protein
VTLANDGGTFENLVDLTKVSGVDMYSDSVSNVTEMVGLFNFLAEGSGEERVVRICDWLKLLVPRFDFAQMANDEYGNSVDDVVAQWLCQTEPTATSPFRTHKPSAAPGSTEFDVEAALQEAFREFDLDENGSLSKAEVLTKITELIEKNGNPGELDPEALIEGLWSKQKLNSEGEITIDRFAALRTDIVELVSHDHHIELTTGV